jgi:hypothetical protein
VSGYAYLLGLTGAALVVALVIELLRRRHLRGKYAVLWLALALVCLLFAVFPGLLGALSEVVGVETPANLLFFLAILTMLAVIMQLSYESGATEEETRTLAEEVAFLRLEVESLRADVRAQEAAGRHTGERAS